MYGEGLPQQSEVVVETRSTSYHRRALLTMALEIGHERLAELGINVHVVVHEHVGHPEGEVFDGFVWPRSVFPFEGSDRLGGLRFTLLSSREEPSLPPLIDTVSVKS